MAFKTDSITLKDFGSKSAATTAVGSPAVGDIAVVNGSLQIYGSSDWGAVDASSVSKLSDLTDVVADPTTQHQVAVINGAKNMVFQQITIDNINPANIQIASESFADNDTTIMTSAAIQDKIEAYSYATASSTHTFTNKSGNISQWTNDSNYVADADFTAVGFMKRGASAGSYSVVTDNSTNWNTAFGWGNHASASYLVDLVSDTSPQLGGNLDANGKLIDMGTNNITDAKVGQWDTAYSMRLSLGTTAGSAMEGNTTTISTAQASKLGHITVTQAVDLDTIETQVANGNTAHGWGNHAAAGYLTSGATKFSALSDSNTPATLQPSDVGKVVVVSTVTGAAAVFDVVVTSGVAGIYTWHINNVYYKITLSSGANDTAFSGASGADPASAKAAVINNAAADNDMGAAIRTLFSNTFATDYTISGTNNRATATAKASGAIKTWTESSSSAAPSSSWNVAGTSAGTDDSQKYSLSTPVSAVNHVQNTAFSNDLIIPKDSSYREVLAINTFAQTTEYSVHFDHPEGWANNAAITVMNASAATLQIAKVGSPSTGFEFNCPQLYATTQASLDLGVGQQGLFVKTGTGTNNVWDVIISSI